MENRTVYLVRHGKIRQEDNQRRYIGQLDLPLSEEGILQSRGLQKLLEGAELKTAYCSDLARSRHTAQVIADGKAIDIQPLSDLREIALGEWEGRSFADIARRWPDEFRARGEDIGYYRTPGGESFADCQKRVMRAFQQILTGAPGNVLIVGHAGSNRVLLCQILGLPLDNLFRIEQDFGCVNIIQCTQAGYKLKLLNFTKTIKG